MRAVGLISAVAYFPSISLKKQLERRVRAVITVKTGCSLSSSSQIVVWVVTAMKTRNKFPTPTTGEVMRIEILMRTDMIFPPRPGMGYKPEEWKANPFLKTEISFPPIPTCREGLEAEISLKTGLFVPPPPTEVI